MSWLASTEHGLAPTAGSVLLAAGVGVALAGALFTVYGFSTKRLGLRAHRHLTQVNVSAPVVLIFGLSILTLGVLLYQ